MATTSTSAASRPFLLAFLATLPLALWLLVLGNISLFSDTGRNGGFFEPYRLTFAYRITHGRLSFQSWESALVRLVLVLLLTWLLVAALAGRRPAALGRLFLCGWAAGTLAAGLAFAIDLPLQLAFLRGNDRYTYIPPGLPWAPAWQQYTGVGLTAGFGLGLLVGVGAVVAGAVVRPRAVPVAAPPLGAPLQWDSAWAPPPAADPAPVPDRPTRAWSGRPEREGG